MTQKEKDRLQYQISVMQAKLDGKEIERKYVDLGLPSGTLWTTENEKCYYTFDEANKKFNDIMPSKNDFDELIRECYHKWDEKRKGVEFFGLNGNTIFFPACGCRFKSKGSLNNVGSAGCYWSNSPSIVSGYYLYFHSDYISSTYTYNCAFGFSVRLVKHKG